MEWRSGFIASQWKQNDTIIRWLLLSKPFITHTVLSQLKLPWITLLGSVFMYAQLTSKHQVARLAEKALLFLLKWIFYWKSCSCHWLLLAVDHWISLFVCPCCVQLSLSHAETQIKKKYHSIKNKYDEAASSYTESYTNSLYWKKNTGHCIFKLCAQWNVVQCLT